ncbi:MAG: hypothetical protein JW995_01155 [Melioribacteraceae bacterium]|nr:hypothetical protein [Melioribacteraceae bacterium]
MAKKLFKNYTFNFDKNESKIITTFCNQAIKQMGMDDKFAKDISAYQSIINKINSDPSEVKLTKDEKIRITRQLQENVKFIGSKMNKSWFLMKWFYRSMYNQYIALLDNHFRD